MLRIWLEKYRHCKIGSNGNGTSVVDGVVDGCKKKRCGILQPNWKAYKLGELRHQNKKKIIKLNKNEHRKFKRKHFEKNIHWCLLPFQFGCKNKILLHSLTIMDQRRPGEFGRQ